jgi:hypothetical protein
LGNRATLVKNTAVIINNNTVNLFATDTIEKSESEAVPKTAFEQRVAKAIDKGSDKEYKKGKDVEWNLLKPLNVRSKVKRQDTVGKDGVPVYFDIVFSKGPDKEPAGVLMHRVVAGAFPRIKEAQSFLYDLKGELKEVHVYSKPKFLAGLKYRKQEGVRSDPKLMAVAQDLRELFKATKGPVNE